MDSEMITRMADEIQHGVPKNKSRWCNDPGFDEEWDNLAADIELIDGMIPSRPE